MKLPDDNPSPEQEYVLRTCLGRMVKQITPEKRVLKFLFFSINKMTWTELKVKAKRYDKLVGFHFRWLEALTV